MASRPTRAEHDAAVARRLRLLGDEVAGVRGQWPPGEGAPGSTAAADHTRVSARRTWEPPGPRPEPAPVVPAPGRHASRRPARAWTWLPETLRGRVALGPGPLAVVALVVAAGLAVTAWWVVRADTSTVTPVGPVAPVSSSAAALAPVGSASPTAGTDAVTVDVAGKVRRPGIAVLDAGARVVDAIRAAGGARRGVDLTGLNLARPLVDGEQVLVGVPVPAVAGLPSAPGTPTDTVVNINTASQVELESLPEVGPVTAQAIIGWREENGGFTSISELLEVDGIGQATLDTLAPLVTV